MGTPVPGPPKTTATQQSTRLVDSDVGGFFLWPPSWIVERPQQQDGTLALDDLTREVFGFIFDCGINVKVSVQGYFVFDFAGCSDMSIGKPGADWRDRVFTRMRFMNLYLVCIYTALTRLRKVNVEKHYVDETTYFAARTFELNPFHASCDMRQASILQTGLEFQAASPPLTVYSEEVLKLASELTNKAYAEAPSETYVLAEARERTSSPYFPAAFSASRNTRSMFNPRTFRISSSEYPRSIRTCVMCG